jgi:hypothetical protein
LQEGDSFFIKGGGNDRDAMPQVIATDIPACNGVIHVVDKVMLPKDVTLPAPTAPEPSVAPATTGPPVEEAVCTPVDPESSVSEEFIVYTFDGEYDFDSNMSIIDLNIAAAIAYNELIGCVQSGAVREIFDAMFEAIDLDGEFDPVYPSFLLRVGTFCNACTGFIDCPDDAINLFDGTGNETIPADDVCSCPGPDTDDHVDLYNNVLGTGFNFTILNATQLCVIPDCIPENNITFYNSSGVCLGGTLVLSDVPSEFPSEVCKNHMFCNHDFE